MLTTSYVKNTTLFYAFCVRGCVASHVESDPPGQTSTAEDIHIQILPNWIRRSHITQYRCGYCSWSTEGTLRACCRYCDRSTVHAVAAGYAHSTLNGTPTAVASVVLRHTCMRLT